MTDRNTVERTIDEQTEALGRVLDLITSQATWSDWPEEDKGVLVAAMTETGRSAFEDRKARDLVRHLFRGELPDLGDASTVRPDLAERVRADLPGLVRLGAGRHLRIGMGPRPG